MAEAWKRFRRDRLALAALAAILILTATALLAPWLAPYDPAQQFFDGLTIEGAPLAPGARYLLGTDLLGRDLLSRLIYGARTSLMIGVAANSAAVALGALVGVLAGYLQGPIGFVLMRFTDLMIAFPALLLAIALAAIFAPSLWIVAMVIAMVNWVQVARIIYTETTSLATLDYIEATRALVPPGPGSCFATSCPILRRPCWSGAPWASPPRCCWRRPCRSWASACVRPRLPGAASSSRASPIS